MSGEETSRFDARAAFLRGLTPERRAASKARHWARWRRRNPVTKHETIELLKLITSLDQRRVFGDPEIDSWHQVIGDLDYPACRDAVLAHYRASDACLMPAAIRAHAHASRTQAASVARAAAVPDADPDDVPGYLAALRARRYRAV